jgi:glycosyltransferase involved in cell wall biosynthesis
MDSRLVSQRLRIGIDAHAIGSRLGGNETYILDILAALEDHPEHSYYVYVSDSAAAERAREVLPSAAALRTIGHANPLVRLGYRLTQLCAADKVDVLHVQYVSPLISPKIVATIHDLSFLHHPEWYSRAEALRFRITVPWTARRAQRILTVSEHARNDIIQTLGVAPSKVSFSYNRLRPVFSPRNGEEVASVLGRLGIERPYVLTVGNLQPRKNVSRLIEAWTNLRRSSSDFSPKLVVVGRRAWIFDPIFAAAKNSEFANDVIFTDYVPEQELPALMTGATVFAYPSLFEGFGYPAVEAMACGAPVLTSNVTALPEVCGEAAVYVDPENLRDIENKLLGLYRSEERRAELRVLGLARAERYRQVDLGGVAVEAYEQAGGGNAGFKA